MIKLENVSKTYDNGCGIKNISADIADNAIVNVYGPTGSGKTTLLSVIKEKKADSGVIEVNGDVTVVSMLEVVEKDIKRDDLHKEMLNLAKERIAEGANIVLFESFDLNIPADAKRKEVTKLVNEFCANNKATFIFATVKKMNGIDNVQLIEMKDN